MQLIHKDSISAKQSWFVDRELAPELVALADLYEVSLFKILLAVLNILLYRYTDREHSSIAIPVDNRDGIDPIRDL
jgi:non-ribosomal peptide synthetase component F